MNSLILYFEDNKGDRREIGRPLSTEEVFKIINNFLEEHSYKSYYTRIWIQNGETYYDVGSWSEFFVSVEE